MPSRYRSTAVKYASKVTNHSVNYAGRIAEKSIVGLARWAMTDHMNTSQLLANIPKMGFIDTLVMTLGTLLSLLLGAVASGAMVFLMIAFGIPLLLSL
jgi:hypothetical protein